MLLVIDTALAAQSLALLDDGRVISARHGVIGRGHAEALMPALAALLAEAGIERPDVIAVDIGPGSFTGLRIGIAAARALGLGWSVPVGGYASLALVAAPVFAAHPELAALTAVAEAGRGLLYVQRIARDFSVAAPAVAMPAEEVAATSDLPLAGPGAARAAAGTSLVVLGDDWPDARHAALLPAALRQLPSTPSYISAPDTAAAA